MPRKRATKAAMDRYAVLDAVEQSIMKTLFRLAAKHTIPPDLVAKIAVAAASKMIVLGAAYDFFAAEDEAGDDPPTESYDE